jgi:hypothetical protein
MVASVHVAGGEEFSVVLSFTQIFSATTTSEATANGAASGLAYANGGSNNRFF